MRATRARRNTIIACYFARTSAQFSLARSLESNRPLDASARKSARNLESIYGRTRSSFVAAGDARARARVGVLVRSFLPMIEQQRAS